LQQCLKYCRDWEKKINGNVKPFIKAKSQFTNARFFEEDDASKETTPSTITSMSKGGIKRPFKLQRKTFPNNGPRRKKASRETHPLLSSRRIKRSPPPYG